MNYNKSYFKKYENNHIMNKNIYIDNCDFIVEKKNHNYCHIESNNNIDNTVILQNKVEELFLKLKFLNSNMKNLNIDIYDGVNDIYDGVNDINDIDNNLNKNSNSVIDLIDEIILKLDKKIICKGQIKRKNNLIDLQF